MTRDAIRYINLHLKTTISLLVIEVVCNSGLYDSTLCKSGGENSPKCVRLLNPMKLGQTAKNRLFEATAAW